MIERYELACGDAGPGAGAGGGGMCPRAVAACATLGEDGVMFWRYTAPAGTDDWTFAGQVCRDPAEVTDNAVPVVTAEDFRRLPLPAGRIRVEPPDGRTLVNVPTNVYVGAGVVVLPTAVLGVPVRVRATPSAYRWSFGDGTSLDTTDPGAPYPDLRTTHVYRRPGTARLSLTTTYAGEYSVGGGPWLPIDGTAQVVSAATTLTVLAAENRLVADPIR